MIWKNLQNMKCPTCSGEVKKTAKGTGYRCMLECGFFITTGKFNNIIDKIYRKNPREVERDNLAELNNL